MPCGCRQSLPSRHSMTPEQLAEQREREAVIAEQQAQVNAEREAARERMRAERLEQRQARLYARRRNA